MFSLTEFTGRNYRSNNTILEQGVRAAAILFRWVHTAICDETSIYPSVIPRAHFPDPF